MIAPGISTLNVTWKIRSWRPLCDHKAVKVILILFFLIGEKPSRKHFEKNNKHNVPLFGLNIFYSEEKNWARHTTRQCPLQRKYFHFLQLLYDLLCHIWLFSSNNLVVRKMTVALNVSWSYCYWHISMIDYKKQMWEGALHKKATIHQLTTMIATSKNVLFPGHNQWYWWPNTLIITRVLASKGHPSGG